MNTNLKYKVGEIVTITADSYGHCLPIGSSGRITHTDIHSSKPYLVCRKWVCGYDLKVSEAHKINELSKEDQERIESASKIFQNPQTFVSGAKFQHNHSFKSGFNEAIEEVKDLLLTLRWRADVSHPTRVLEEIEKLKR